MSENSEPTSEHLATLSVLLPRSLFRRRSDEYGSQISLDEGGKFSIGSGPTNDLVVPGRKIQSFHAVISASRAALTLTQLTPRAYILLNGSSISGSVKLRSGDILKIGKTRISVSLSTEIEIDDDIARGQGMQSIAKRTKSRAIRDMLRAIRKNTGKYLTALLLCTAGIFIIAFCIVFLSMGDESEEVEEIELPTLEGFEGFELPYAKAPNWDSLDSEVDSRCDDLPPEELAQTPSYKNIDFGPESIKDSFAFWQPDLQTLEIALFNAPLSEEDRETLIREKDLTAVRLRKPPFRLQTRLRDGICDLEHLSDCRLFLDVHSTDGSVPCGKPVDPSSESNAITSFVCGTSTNLRVSGALSGSHKLRKRCANKGDNWVVNWNVSFNAMIMDITLREAARYAWLSGLPTIPKGAIGSVRVGEKITNLKYALALYNKTYNHLNIGFYDQALTPEERKRVQRNRSVASAVNRKRPVVIALLRFATPPNELSADLVSAYSISLPEDSSEQYARLRFSEPKTIDRKKVESVRRDVVALSGSLKDGSTLTAALRGIEAGSKTDDASSWYFNFSADVVTCE